MYPQAKGIATYGRMANTETDPIRQIVMLYDGAIKFINKSAMDIENADLPGKAEHSKRALDIICYMQSILDFERGGEVAVGLDNLYRSITALILRASAQLDAALMRKAAELLLPVRDAWEVNAMNNSKQVETASLAGVGVPALGGAF